MSTDKQAPAGQSTGGRTAFRGIGDPYQNYQEKRRRNALQRQKAARLHSSNRARTLALEQEQQEDGAKDGLSAAPDQLDGTVLDPREHSTTEDAEMEPSTSYRTTGSFGRGRGRRKCGRVARGSAWQRQEDQATAIGGVRAYGQRYGNELMQPEWMTDIPRNLATSWLVMPRPEGMRCLLVTSRGRTVSWLRNGAPLHRFHSRLPGGSPATVAGCGGSAAAAAASVGDYCLLDCIFHPPNNTYYVQDLLCWRGYALYDTAAEFRIFWLNSKFQEEGLLRTPAMECCGGDRAGGGAAAAEAASDVDVDMRAAAAAGSSGASGSADGVHGAQGGQPVFRVVPLPVRPCTLQALRAAYGTVPPPPAAAGVAFDGTNPWVAVAGGGGGGGGVGSCADMVMGGASWRASAEVADLRLDFLRDGLYFLHRQGHYCPGPGTTPLALLWKDLGCSRYLLDTDSAGQPLEHQTVVLSYRADRTVATEDDPPVVLGRLPEAFVVAMGDKLKPGRLLRFSIRQGGIIFHEGRPAGADLHYEGPANQRRGRADSFSKILFQRLARTAPITASMLAEAVMASELTAAAAEAAAEEGAQAAAPSYGNGSEGAVALADGGDMATE